MARRLSKGGVGESPQQLLDLQLFFEHVLDKRVRDALMTKLLSHMGVPEADTAAYHVAQSEILTARELSKHMIPHEVTQCLSNRAYMLLALYTHRVGKASDTARRQQLVGMSANRWDHGRNGGARAFWFNAAHDFIPRSIECFGSHDEVAKAIPRLQLECDIDLPLGSVPPQYGMQFSASSTSPPRS